MPIINLYCVPPIVPTTCMTYVLPWVTPQAGKEVITIAPETAPVKLNVPVDCPLAGKVVPTQGIPGETEHAVVLALWLLLFVLELLDVNGIIPAKPGKRERIAKTNALAPTTTTITPIVQISITFAMPLVVGLETAPVV